MEWVSNDVVWSIKITNRLKREILMAEYWRHKWDILNVKNKAEQRKQTFIFWNCFYKKNLNFLLFEKATFCWLWSWKLPTSFFHVLRSTVPSIVWREIEKLSTSLRWYLNYSTKDIAGGKRRDFMENLFKRSTSVDSEVFKLKFKSIFEGEFDFG